MATDIRTSELKSPVDVAEYLFRRLHEVGIRGVHGVPGDYNLVSRYIRPQGYPTQRYPSLTVIGSPRLHSKSRP